MKNSTTSFEKWISSIIFDENTDICQLYDAVQNRHSSGKFKVTEKEEGFEISSYLESDTILEVKSEKARKALLLDLNTRFEYITNGENIADWCDFNEAASKED